MQNYDPFFLRKHILYALEEKSKMSSYISAATEKLQHWVRYLLFAKPGHFSSCSSPWRIPGVYYTFHCPLYTTINTTNALMYVVVFKNKSGLWWILPWANFWLEGNSDKNFSAAALYISKRIFNRIFVSEILSHSLLKSLSR